MELGAIGHTVILFSLLNLVLSQFDCPDPWKQFGGKCYKFEKIKDTLQGAEEDCASDGASLVSVNDQSEHDFIVDILEEDLDYTPYFTSGQRDALEAERFYWTGDGSIIEGFQNWQDDQDRFIKGHDVIVYDHDGKTWSWVLVERDESHKYVCEISRSDVYKIIQEVRGFDYGSPETIATFLPHGPIFKAEGQPVNVIHDISSAENYVTLECRADAIPPPSYQWFIRRDQRRQPIDPLVDIRYTVINGKLIIHDPKDSTDNGDYQCVAQNPYGSVLSNSATLSFGFLLDFPKSNRDPVSVSEYAGVGIECNPPEHYPALSYSWYKDDIRNFIRPSLKPYTFISHNGKLYFSSVTEDDEGDYFCMVTTTNDAVTSYQGTISTGIPLIVNEAIASVREPQIASGFPTVFPSSPLQGDTVRVECFAWGTDNLGYTWERVDAPMPPGSVIEDYGRVLKLPNIEIIHGGDYRCTVTRENGQSSSGIIRVPVDALPFFTIPLQAQHMDKNADLTWRCIANGVPQVQYQWFRNATLIEEDQTIRPEDRERIRVQNNILMITNVQEKDSAMYQCAATNLHGTRYSSAQLRVLSFAPTFRKFPLQPHTYATMRGNVTLICHPEAAPAAEKEWFKNDRAFSSSKAIMLPNGNMILTRITTSDAGKYTCKAKNIHGEAESSTDVVVLSTTAVSLSPFDETVMVNTTTFLPCEASFNPQLDLTYTWYQNDFLINFERIRTIGMNVYIEKDPYFHRGTGTNTGGLVIYPTQFWHAGEYKCVVQSSSDKVERTATLRVIGPPGPPAGVFGEGVTSSSIILTWMEGATNGRAILGYVVESFNEWEKIWREHKTNIRGRDLAEKRTNISELSPWSQYKFRIRAENSLGIGKPSAESESYTTSPAVPYKYPLQVGGGGGKVGALVMTWEPLPARDQNGEGFGYIVRWKKRFLIDDEWSTFQLTGADHNRYVTTVRRDNFYQQYDVRVQAFNEVGRGPMSPIVTIMSAEDIPNGVPTNVRAFQYNATALLVEWTPVPDTRESVRGVLLGYRINYWKEIGEDETMAIFNTIRGQTDHGFVVGLDPRTYYYVNVQVYNSAGNGPKSEDFLEETLRAAPKEAPQEVHLDVLGSNSIKIEWRGVSTDQSEEPLQGYKVEYWRSGETRYVAQYQDSGKKTHMKLEELEQGVLYNMRVRGYSRGGDGLASSPTIQFMLGADCQVLENSPDKRFVYACKGCMVHISSILSLALLIFHIIKSTL